MFYMTPKPSKMKTQRNGKVTLLWTVKQKYDGKKKGCDMAVIEKRVLSKAC